MTVIQIPLDKNPDVAALLADKEPGDRVYACFSLKAQDAQTASLRIEEFADSAADLSKADEESANEDDTAEEAAGETDKSPEGKESEAEPYTGKTKGSMGRELAAKMMGGDNGSSF